MAGESDVLGVWDCAINLAMILKCVGIRAVESASLKVGKSLKIG